MYMKIGCQQKLWELERDGGGGLEVSRWSTQHNSRHWAVLECHWGHTVDSGEQYEVTGRLDSAHQPSQAFGGSGGPSLRTREVKYMYTESVGPTIMLPSLTCSQ
ncbi:hypothetical protein Pcinc_019271 [Petrolisthes cinctipes]|uniref:Uncharacterized protein n=1 Tax=Petrolisthes cinctipes TaxID=88211 RepID=A0AAE1FKG4_PETCI|nr:hypothetical protein Pcinc_019271 [Petrolisthes cinctipes]